MNKRISFSNKNLFFALYFLGLIPLLISMNKYWAPFDEGIVTVAAAEILAGKIPYKDFFVALYPPGQFYILATLYKIFGVTLETGRCYTCLVQALLPALIFLVTFAVTRKRVISLIAWFLSLASIGLRLGVTPSPIWPGMTTAILSLYLFMKYVELDKTAYLLYSGFAAGVSALFRHDIGAFVVISVLMSLFAYRRAIKEFSGFILAALAAPLFFIIHLFLKSASRDMFESLFLFPFIHEKTAYIPFPKPCFDLTMIFHKSLHFININQYYIPLLIYAAVGLFLIGAFVYYRKFGKTEIALLALVLFGVFSFNQVRIRTDPQHLLTTIHPAFPLFGFILSRAFFGKDKSRMARALFLSSAVVISFLFFLLTVKNLDKFVKNVFRKPYKGKVILTDFTRGSVHIPKEERDDFVNTVIFIKERTKPSERIYVGNTAHWKDDFGGSTIIYFLAERLPSTKYYEILPGLITKEKVQREIADSLGKDNVKLIVLQDIELPAEGKDLSPHVLDDYIKEHFSFVKKFGKYNVYEKR